MVLLRVRAAGPHVCLGSLHRSPSLGLRLGDRGRLAPLELELALSEVRPVCPHGRLASGSNVGVSCVLPRVAVCVKASVLFVVLLFLLGGRTLFPQGVLLHGFLKHLLGLFEEGCYLPRELPHVDPQFCFYAGIVPPHHCHQLVCSSGCVTSFVVPLDIALGLLLVQCLPRLEINEGLSSPVVADGSAYHLSSGVAA